MKICWDNLEGVYLSKNGTFRKSTSTYIYKESCTKCGEPYLTIKSNQSRFCTFSCFNIGRGRTNEQKKRMSDAQTGKTMSIEARRKMSKNGSKRVGILNSNYKGKKVGLTVYDKYKDRLKFYEDIRKQKNSGLLETRCTYCGGWYTPTYTSVINRLTAINELKHGECRLYCSANCKLACPTYGRIKYPRGFKHTTSREVSTYLRQIVLERDNWTCQICGKTIKEAQLHVHHMDPVAQNPMFQNDKDSCITLCKACHAMVHSRKGCRYVDLQCKNKF
jgi:5-methylcytosine-specific restriction endonuclease McrA